MEFTFKITNEQLLNLFLEQKNITETQNKVIEEPVKKRRGRPRLHPVKDPTLPKRKVGRPKKLKINL